MHWKRCLMSTTWKLRELLSHEWQKKSLLSMNVHVLYVLEDKTSKKKFRLSICLSVCLSVRMSGCTWTFATDTITFEGVSGSKQNLVGVFYVWNVGLVLKSKVKSWSWSWSWTEFWFCTKTLRSDTKFSGYL